MFFTSRKIVLKSWLDTSSILCYLSSFSSIFLNAISTPPRYLVDRLRKLLPLRQLLDTCWIDRASVLNLTLCLLDSFLDTLAIEDQILDTYLDRSLDTSRYLHLSRFTSCLYKASVRSGNHFSSISLSILLCFSPKTLSSYSKPFPQGFFKLFQVSLYLVSS